MLPRGSSSTLWRKEADDSGPDSISPARLLPSVLARFILITTTWNPASRRLSRTWWTTAMLARILFIPWLRIALWEHTTAPSRVSILPCFRRVPFFYVTSTADHPARFVCLRKRLSRSAKPGSNLSLFKRLALYKPLPRSSFKMWKYMTGYISNTNDDGSWYLERRFYLLRSCSLAELKGFHVVIVRMKAGVHTIRINLNS